MAGTPVDQNVAIPRQSSWRIKLREMDDDSSQSIIVFMNLHGLPL